MEQRAAAELSRRRGMRTFTDRRKVGRSLGAGVLLGLACTPLILEETPHPKLQTMQLIALPLLTALFVQAAAAWTPRRMSLAPPDDHGSSRLWLELLVLAALFAVYRCAADPLIRQFLVVLPISTWSAFARKLPFTVLVQPLFLIVGVYACAYRLSARERVAAAAVVLVHQMIVMLQFSGSLDPAALAAVIVLAGVNGLVGAVAYSRYGIVGPVTVSLLAYARHGVRLSGL